MLEVSTGSSRSTNSIERASARRRRTQLFEGRFLVPVHQGVFRLGSHDVGFEQACLGACLALSRLRGQRTVGGPSRSAAAHAHRIRSTCSGERTNACALAMSWCTARRCSRQGTGRLATDGIRLLRPVRLAADLARFLDDHDLESVVEQIDRSGPGLHAGAPRVRATARWVRAVMASRRFARVLDGRPAWNKPKDSDLEVRLFRALDGARRRARTAGLDRSRRRPIAPPRRRRPTVAVRRRGRSRHVARRAARGTAGQVARPSADADRLGRRPRD